MKDVLQTIIETLVEDKTQIQINQIDGEKSIVFEVKVAPEDMGRVIGKEGRIAKAIRTIFKAVATREQKESNNRIYRLGAKEINAKFIRARSNSKFIWNKGFLKVVPYTDDITRFDKLKTIFIERNKKLEEMEIEEVKYHKNLVLLKLKGIDDINDTIKYKNCYIKIDRKDAVNLPEDTYFIVDLIGIEVFTDEGKSLGNLVDVFPTGSNDVYVVKDELGKQTLLPAIGDVIKEVDIENKKMIVHLIEGLEVN